MVIQHNSSAMNTGRQLGLVQKRAGAYLEGGKCPEWHEIYL